jgi:hypothetical protein
MDQSEDINGRLEFIRVAIEHPKTNPSYLSGLVDGALLVMLVSTSSDSTVFHGAAKALLKLAYRLDVKGDN